jgi:hypothetical protein
MSVFLIFILLGLAHLVPSFLAWRQPVLAGEGLRKFPRHVPTGIFLMLAATLWFFGNLYQSNLDDFREWRPIIYTAVIVIGLGNCFFVKDYLSVRALGVVALLACDVILDAQRTHPDILLKFPLPLWCYLIILISVWIVMAPWRLRNWIEWATTSEERFRRVAQVGMGLGGLFVLLGLILLAR